jgi:ABC-type amino acid transport substrate-binding protein
MRVLRVILNSMGMQTKTVANARLLALAACLAMAFAAGLSWSTLSSASAPACRGAAQPMARIELLFGRARANAAPVSDGEWTGFLDREVTPRFPAGFTVLRGPGQWRGSDGRVAREEAHVLLIWHDSTLGADARIEAIRSAYRQNFDQESVMRVDGLSCVSF